MGNFLGLAAGAGGAGLAASQLPAGGEGLREAAANRPAGGNRPVADQRPAAANRLTPEQRDNWSQRSQNRDGNWQQAVNNRQDYWNDWSGNRQQNLDDFRQNQDQRWDNIKDVSDDRQDWFNDAQDDRQDWRVDNREDWQEHREDLWDYRYDRADDLWDDVRDYHDDLFDDQWWGGSFWGVGYYPPAYQYPSNPWWWWVPTAWSTVSSIVDQPDPVYYDNDVTVIYQGDQVYQNGQPPVPADQYREQAIALAANVEQPPPPAPPENSETEWMPLGVWALAPEDKGEAVMFFQISVNREGIISGGYQNVMAGESKPIAGSVDKQTQRVAWRIGDNENTVIETGLYNLTTDVTTVSIHFDKTQTQTWMLVRLPAPQMPNAPTKIDTGGERKLPPVMGAPEGQPAAPAAPSL